MASSYIESVRRSQRAQRAKESGISASEALDAALKRLERIGADQKKWWLANQPIKRPTPEQMQDMGMPDVALVDRNENAV